MALYYNKIQQEEMASCGFCQRGLREQFVAKSDRAEYIRCSKRACSYFCLLDKLASHERVVQLDVAQSPFAVGMRHSVNTRGSAP